MAGVCACAFSAPSCATWTRVPCARCATSGCRPTCRSDCAASPTRPPRPLLCAPFSSSTLLPPLPPSDPTPLFGPSYALECTAIACVPHCAFRTTYAYSLSLSPNYSHLSTACALHLLTSPTLRTLLLFIPCTTCPISFAVSLLQFKYR